MKFIDFEKLAALFLKYWDKFLIDGVEYTLALAAITVAFGAVFAVVGWNAFVLAASAVGFYAIMLL